MTGVFEAFLAGIYAEIKMVTRLSAAAAAMAGTDTDKVRGTVLWIIFRNFPATTGSRSRTLPIPANMPAGIPAAPMQALQTVPNSEAVLTLHPPTKEYRTGVCVRLVRY